MYRKFSADQIFNGNQFLQEYVLITDIDGVIVDLVAKPEAGENIEQLNGILCPGFINAHCHLELSHMKGLIPKQTGLVDFVLKVVNERHIEEAEILSAINIAEDEMLRNGIVAVGDICNNTLTIPQKKKNRIAYHNFIEASGFPPAVAVKRFTGAENIYAEYQKNSLNVSIVPHASYSGSPELFEIISNYPNNNLITIHNQETGAENEFFESNTGDLKRMYQQMGIDISFFSPSKKTSLQTWLPHFTKQQTIILVHNVCTSEEDIEFEKRTSDIEHRSSFFCLCPNANLYISDILPDVKMLMEQQCRIVLGTDSLASNDQLSILEEMKTLQRYFPELQMPTLLQWATSNGSRALCMDDSLGSFEKTKKPGVVLIEGVDDVKFNKTTTSRRIL